MMEWGWGAGGEGEEEVVVVHAGLLGREFKCATLLKAAKMQSVLRTNTKDA